MYDEQRAMILWERACCARRGAAVYGIALSHREDRCAQALRDGDDRRFQQANGRIAPWEACSRREGIGMPAWLPQSRGAHTR